MPRNDRSYPQRGSTSLLFAIVVVPLILVFLAVIVEVSQFFGMREEALQGLDSELAVALRTMEGAGTTSDKIRVRLSHLGALLTVEDVRVARDGAIVDGLVRGSFHGPLTELAFRLTGGAVDGAPFEIVARARRPRSGVLLVLDRTIPLEGDPCSDPGLRTRAEGVSRISERLRGAGISSVRIAVVPGVLNEIDLLGDEDGVPRCSGSDSSYGNARSVQGVSHEGSIDPLATGMEMVESVASTVASGLSEQGVVIIVGSNTPASDDRIAAALSLLEEEAVRQRFVIRAIGVIVGDFESTLGFRVMTLRRHISLRRCCTMYRGRW
jgi:hypothetical protein